MNAAWLAARAGPSQTPRSASSTSTHGAAPRRSRHSPVSAEDTSTSATATATRQPRRRRSGVACSSRSSACMDGWRAEGSGLRPRRSTCRSQPGTARSLPGRSPEMMRASTCSPATPGRSAPNGCRPVSASYSATQKLN